MRLLRLLVPVLLMALSIGLTAQGGIWGYLALLFALLAGGLFYYLRWRASTAPINAS